MSTNTDAAVFFEQHEERLNQALEVLATRGYWAPYPEHTKSYPEAQIQGAQAAFEARLNQHYPLKGATVVGQAGNERSPYGFDLGITYDQYDTNELMDHQQAAMASWRNAGVKARVGVCLEAIQRLNAISGEMAQAVQHTSGQSNMMAFQAGGPHAQDRAVEAVATAWKAMRDVPESGEWHKPMGRRGTQSLSKRWHIVPRGISLAVACCTFPTWNTYPGLFASLVTGNPVLVKPHPGSILPLAMSVEIIQQVLEEAGFDPLLVALVVDTPEQPLAKVLAEDKRVQLIDFTGSSEFGNWLEQNATHAQVFTEKAGLNTVIIDSVDNIKAVTGNLGFSLSLYSGQMCTSPQAIYVPRTGITAGDTHMSFDDVANAIKGAVQHWMADKDMACSFLGAIQSERTNARIDACREQVEGRGTVLLDSEHLTHPEFPDARVRTPLLLSVDGKDVDLYGDEQFGPIAYVIATDSTEHSMELARQTIGEKGAIALALYSTDDEVLDQGEELAQDVCVSLSVNLDGGFYMNQSATFSDFHATGGNAAANTAFTDGAFVSRRFVVVQSRRPM